MCEGICSSDRILTLRKLDDRRTEAVRQRRFRRIRIDGKDLAAVRT
jgi:hypothetical protein